MRSETGGLSCTRSYPSSLLKIIVFCSATLISLAVQADFVQTNLVSDIQGFAELLTRIVVARPSENRTSKLPHSGTASCLIMRIASSHLETLYAFGDLSSAA